MATASNIPWTWYESLKGREVEFVNKYNEKSHGRLAGFKPKYGEQFAIIKKPGFIFYSTYEIPISGICFSNFERMGYTMNHPLQQTKQQQPRNPIQTKPETRSKSSRVSLEDSPYTFRYEEVEYQKVDRVINFRISDQVVWKVPQEKRDPTKPLIGRIQDIGFAMHSPSTYVAVVLFDENTTYYPKHVNLTPLHRNVVNVPELELLTTYMEFWCPHSIKNDIAMFENQSTSGKFENIMENKTKELVNQIHAHTSKNPILPSDSPKLYSVQREDSNPTSFNIADESRKEEENLLVTFTPEMKPKLYHKVIGIPKQEPLIPDLASKNNLSINTTENGASALIPINNINTPDYSVDDIDLKMSLEDFQHRLVNGSGNKIMGFQGHNSSCHLDASLFALFGFSRALDKYILPEVEKTEVPEHGDFLVARNIVEKNIVQEWRKKYFVGKKNVAKLRNILVEKFGPSFNSSYKDAEETMLALFQLVKIPPLFHYDDGEGDHIHQILMPETWDPSQRLPYLTIQTLLEDSFKVSDVLLNKKPKRSFILKLPVSDGVLIPCDGVIPNLTLRLSSLIKTENGKEGEVHVLELSAIICLRRSHFVTIARMKPDLKSEWIFMDSKPTTSVPEVEIIEGLSEVIVEADKRFLEGKFVSDFELPNGYMLFRDAYISVYTPASEFIV